MDVTGPRSDSQGPAWSVRVFKAWRLETGAASRNAVIVKGLRKMTLDEMQKVAWAVGAAHSACSICVQEIVDLLAYQFPEFKFMVTDETVYELDPTKEQDPDPDWQEKFPRRVVRVEVH